MNHRQNRKWVWLGFAVLAATGGTACNKDKTEAAASSSQVAAPQVQQQGRTSNRIAVTVDGQGYRPASVKAPAGQAIELEFTRTTDQTCGKEVVFPSLNIRRDLPLNQPVTVPLTMPASGSLAFTCGMDMFRGSVVVQ
ncbi:MAG: cupredoxin domain-containing protein [Deltaproteobacteria bacterium]